MSTVTNEASFEPAFINQSADITFSGVDIGRSFSAGGDFNGDGFEDLILAGNGTSNKGEVIVIFGQANGFPASVDLSNLDDSNSFVISGIDDDDYAYRASFIGDFNRDGIDDLIIGASGVDGEFNVDYSKDAGAAYVVFGSRSLSSGSLNLGDLDGTNGFAYLGYGNRIGLGAQVSEAGDFNNDGFDDFFVTQGTVDLIYGTDQQVPAGIFGAGYDSPYPYKLDVNTNPGRKGFVVYPGHLDSTQNYSGPSSISGLGDVNGDSIDDIIIGFSGHSPDQRVLVNGAWTWLNPYAGSAVILYGGTHLGDTYYWEGSLDGVNGFAIHNTGSRKFFGNTGAGGDFNGDGLNDIIVGAPLGDPELTDGVSENAGQIYVIYGSTAQSPTLKTDSLDGNNGFVINGIDSSDLAGASVTMSGDFNNDGFNDILISAPEAASAAGEVYLIYGSENFSYSSFDLDSLNGVNGTIVTGANEGDRIFVDSVTDFNNDQIDDIIISTNQIGGEAYVVYGSDSIPIFQADTTPYFQSASTSIDGSSVILSYDQILDSIDTPQPSAFDVQVNGTSATISSVSVNGYNVELTLNKAIKETQIININYNDPTGADDAYAIQSLSYGTDAASLVNRSVTNISTVDGIPPSFFGSLGSAALVEKGGRNNIVYQADATDQSPLTYSLESADATLFAIDSSTGAVRLLEEANFDRRQNYNFTIRASDAFGNFSDKVVNLTVEDSSLAFWKDGSYRVDSIDKASALPLPLPSPLRTGTIESSPIV